MSIFRIVVLPLILLLCSGAALAADGLIVVKSDHSVATTVDKFEAVLSQKSIKVMSRVNHAAGAESAEMELRPTELVVFGNPKIGTPLMQCEQSVAVDLPQKALIWEDEEGQVWFGYNDPEYLKTRHGIDDCDAVLAKMSEALQNLATAATR